MARPPKDPDELTPHQMKVLAWAKEYRTTDISTIAKNTFIKSERIRRWLRIANGTAKARNPREGSSSKAFGKVWGTILATAEAVQAGPPDPGSFESFRSKYLNVPTYNSATQRKMMVGVTYPFMRDFINALQNHQRVLCLWPIRHGKSTIIEHLMVYTLCKDPNARIYLACATEKKARDRTRAVRRILSDPKMYPELHEKWGHWIGKPDSGLQPWGALEFTVRGRQSPERDASVTALGITGDIYGTRADLFILDDVDTPTTSDNIREQVILTIQGEVIGRLNEGGKLVYIGTRCGVNDVPATLLQSPDWYTEVRQAYENDKPLCPEMYSEEELEKFRADVGETMFQLQSMNNPAPEGSMMFPPQLLDNAKGAFDDAPSDWDFWTGLDPATSGRAAIVTVAHNPNTQEMRVVDCEVRLNPRHDGLTTMISAQLARWKPRFVVVEAQGGSHLLTDVPQVRDLIYDAGARLIEFHTTGVNKHDHQYGVPLLATEMDRGRLRLANSGLAVERLKPLLSDFLAWQPQPGKKARYDSVMALWFAVNSIATKRKPHTQRKIIDPLWKRFRRAG